MGTFMLWLFAIVGWILLGISIWLLNKALKKNEWFTMWIEEFLQRTSLAYEELKRIDSSGHFEADDEVGYFFKALKEILLRLAQMGVLNEEEIKEVEEKEQDQKLTLEELQRVLAERRKKAKTTGQAVITSTQVKKTKKE